MSALFVWTIAAWAAKPKVITALTLGTPPAQGLCPAESYSLEVTAVDEKNRSIPIKRGPKDGLTLTWEMGAVPDKGPLEMPTDARATWSKEGLLVVSTEADPNVRAEMLLPVRYDCSVTIDLSGRPGDFGERGSDGESVADGKGMDGRRGTVGQVGGAAPEVHIRTTLATEPRTGALLLQAEISEFGGSNPRYAAIDPNRGELVVKANGGPGGQGGDGGAAGSGSSGGGRPGDGADGGDGGAGGAVMVFADASTQGVLKSIIIENAGGPGGAGGRGGGRVGNSPGDATDGHTGRQGRPGLDGPPPEVQAAEIEPLW